MFKTETHSHSLPISICSKIETKELVRLYKDAGFDTLFLTNHFSMSHFEKWGKAMTHSERVDTMYNDYLEAKKEGDKIGLIVLFAVEFSLRGNHYLLYGATPEFLKLRDDFFDMEFEEFYKFAKAYGVTVIQAHPFWEVTGVATPQCVDGFEGINQGMYATEMHNDLTLNAAKEYGLPISCGSDTHKTEGVGQTAMLSKEKITSAQQYIDLLFKGELILFADGVEVCNSLNNKTGDGI